MTGLLDIGDLKSSVTIRGVEIEVGGISAETFFDLLKDFPELNRLLSGGAVGGPEIKAQDLLTKVPSAVAGVIAAACGYPRQEAYIAKAASLNIGEQTELIKAGWDCTFPKGVQSFLEALEEVMKVSGHNNVSGWEADTASPEPLSNFGPQASQETKSGG